MPTTLTHSIDIFSDGDYLDEVKVTNNTEVSERRGTDGTFKKVKDFNPTNDFSFKGGGDPAVALGVGTFAITGLTGGVKMIPKYDHTQKNNDFDDFEATGKHYPGATAAS